ncbi:MAG: DUF3858 domain-containing protein [Ferruginibacter sp.]
MSPKPLAVLLAVLVCFSLKAQKDAGLKFGKISPADFTINNPVSDTSYGAVIIADIGESAFVGNDKGWFSLVYKHHRRVKIFNKKGIDLATVDIPLYISSKTDGEEKLESLRAYTYNLEDGKVVETKMDKDAVFQDKLDKNHFVKKFTLPAVKDGSIIEYMYEVKSDFLFNLQPWSFQGKYPRIWSEYRLDKPQFFDYVFLTQGSREFHIHDVTEKFTNYMVRERSETAFGRDDLYSISSNNSVNRWVLTNVEPLREEKFTSTLNNYISRIEFQLSGYNFPNSPYKNIISSWETVTNELMKDEDFGEQLNNANNWIGSEISSFKSEAKDLLDLAGKIFSYVQKNFKSKGERGVRLSQKMKETFKSKSGYVPDINLLLVAILKHEGLDAYPVLLSTRSNGFANPLYPILGRFNYVVAKVKIENTNYYLDASEPYSGFNKLPYYCYNGSARTIGNPPVMENLTADMLSEAKATNIVLMNDLSSKQAWSGFVTTYPGYYQSIDTRKKIQEKGKAAFEKELAESYTGDFVASNFNLERLEEYDKSVKISYSLKVERPDNGNIIYLSPIIKEGLRENYFKSAERKYPVELPYKIDETYQLQVQVPDGYMIDEAPKSEKVSYNENEGKYEYLVSKTDTEISIRSRLTVNKTYFLPDEYESLRGFFDYIVKKHAEQIVFKKK